VNVLACLLYAVAGVADPAQRFEPVAEPITAADPCLDADRAAWSTHAARELGNRTSFRAFLPGRRLLVWGGLTVVAEHRCARPVPGQPICDPWAETAARDHGWMLLLPPAPAPPSR
jgi:hypothetical protein